MILENISNLNLDFVPGTKKIRPLPGAFFSTIKAAALRYYTKASIMGTAIQQLVRNFIGKLRQHPDIYPIRFYKKNRRFRRHWQGPLVK